MNDPSSTPPTPPPAPRHPFVGPGQVAPDRPAPDHCMECGLPEASHGAKSEYMQEAEAQDELLLDRLTSIARQLDAGSLTEREAADMRVAAFEHHLAACRNLRIEYFGE